MNDLRTDKCETETTVHLKSFFESSHNQDDHGHIVALVKFLARRAAEEDFEMFDNALQDHPETLH